MANRGRHSRADVRYHSKGVPREMHIRQANNRDREAITALVFSVLREYGLEPDPDGIDSDLEDIERSYFARGGKLFVLEQERGGIAGTYGLHPINEETCELRKMYLRATARGRGLGKRMLEDAISRAREMGYREITLETASPLIEAIGLYKRFGFVRYANPHLCWRCDQAYRLDLARRTQ